VADWLIVLSADNWTICAREQLIGLGRRADQRFAPMAEGDRVWVYVNKEFVDRQRPLVRSLRAIARVTGPTRKLNEPPWRARGNQAFALARPIEIERTCDVPVGTVLEELWGPSKWGSKLLNAPVRLTDREVRRLEAEVAGSMSNDGH